MVEKSKKRISRILLICITIIMFAKNSYARYIKTDNLKGKQEISIPIIEIEKTEAINITDENDRYYEFWIKNFKGDKINEIKQFYTIEIVSNINEYMQFELYKEDQEIILEKLKTQPILLDEDIQIEHHYKLKIKYNGNKNNNDIMGKIQIKISSEQENKLEK